MPDVAWISEKLPRSLIPEVCVPNVAGHASIIIELQNWCEFVFTWAVERQQRG